MGSPFSSIFSSQRYKRISDKMMKVANSKSPELIRNILCIPVQVTRNSEAMNAS